MCALQLPRSDVLAIIGIGVAAVGSIAAVIAIPGLHDVIFGFTSRNHSAASGLHPATSPVQPGKTESEKETLRTRAATLLSDVERRNSVGQNNQARADY